MFTFFPTWKSNYFRTIVEKTILPSLSCTGTFVRNKIHINHILYCEFISGFCSTSVIFMSILMPIQHFLE